MYTGKSSLWAMTILHILHSLDLSKATVPAATMRAAVFIMVIMAFFAAMAMAGMSQKE